MDEKKIPANIPNGPQTNFDLVASSSSIVRLRQFITPGPPPIELIEFRLSNAYLRLPSGPSPSGVATVYVRATEMPPVGVAILHHMLTVRPIATGFELTGTGSYTVENSGFTVFVDRQIDILFFQ